MEREIEDRRRSGLLKKELRRFNEEKIEVPYNRLEINLRECDAKSVPVKVIGG